MPRRKAGFDFMNTKQLHSKLKKRGSADVSYLQHSVDEMIYTFMAEENIPGLSLAIVQAPYIPRVVGYGYSDAKQKRLVSPNTMRSTTRKGFHPRNKRKQLKTVTKGKTPSTERSAMSRTR